MRTFGKSNFRNFKSIVIVEYSGRNKSLLPPKYFLVLRDFDYKEYYLAISYQKEEWHHFLVLSDQGISMDRVQR